MGGVGIKGLKAGGRVKILMPGNQEIGTDQDKRGFMHTSERK